MNDREGLTLVSLQRLLNDLRIGHSLTLSGAQSRRLFGENDVAELRLNNFARGHGCTVDEVTFMKRARLRASPTEA